MWKSEFVHAEVIFCPNPQRKISHSRWSNQITGTLEKSCSLIKTAKVLKSAGNSGLQVSSWVSLKSTTQGCLKMCLALIRWVYALVCIIHRHLLWILIPKKKKKNQEKTRDWQPNPKQIQMINFHTFSVSPGQEQNTEIELKTYAISLIHICIFALLICPILIVICLPFTSKEEIVVSHWDFAFGWLCIHSATYSKFDFFLISDKPQLFL